MYLIDLAAIGTLILIVYIFFDLFRSRGESLLKRIIFYSFLYYLIQVLQLTTGGIHLPPLEMLRYTISIQLTPFRFFSDWLGVYNRLGFGWHLWYSIKLSFYNLLMLLPLGLYLPVLFNLKGIFKVGLIAALVSLFIEVMQLTFTYLGLTHVRTFNVDDIILNTSGALLGYLLYKLLLSRWIHRLIK